MMYVYRSILIALVIAAVSAAHAVKMDETTHNLVIQRLEIGVQNMDKSEPERIGILLRLADLYADRARLKAMNEISSGSAAKGSKQDRSRAIALYNQVIPHASKEKRGRLVLQLAHLYTLNDQNPKALSLYEQVLKAPKGSFDSEVRALASGNMGDIFFRKNDFKTALSYFENARKEKAKNRALVEYRIAWCLLNLGQNEKATQTLISLLRSPDILALQSLDGKTVDPVFLESASNDLARFLAHGEVTNREIQLLVDLSPDKNRKQNLHTLGEETDRVGKKQTSLMVWQFYLDEGNVGPTDRIEVQTRVTKILYDLGKTSEAAEAFDKSTSLWRNNGCKDTEACSEIKARLRKIATAWNKAQRKNPTNDLFRVYKSFVNTFSDDVEMIHWAAVVGHDLGRHKESAELFRQAALLAQANLKKDPANKSMKNIFEGSLLGEIEMAEAGNDIKARENAYNFYLEVNPNGARAIEVRYQRAQVFYQTNRYREAFSEFHYLTLNTPSDKQDIKTKSADLSLDSLAILKDDESLQVRSLEYARLLPERKTEYLKISRKATMNLVAVKLKDERSNSRADYKKSLATLNQMNLDGADDNEKVKYFKNKVILAQKALEFSAVTDAADQLLAVKSLNADDKEWAMTQKVWAAELQLDFAQAYNLSKAMRFPNLSKADLELRLALLADLAGLDSKIHNEKYLHLSKDGRAANLVRITIIKNSRQPWIELDKQIRYLKTNPDLLAPLVLEIFARQRDSKRAEQLLKTTMIVRYPAGQTLARHLELGNYLAFDKKIRSHKIFSFNEQVMQKTLKERLNLISQADKLAQSALKKRDWTLQVLSATLLARENRRLEQDILALPVPSRLEKDQKVEYQKMIKAQSQTYLNQALKIESEIETMWNSSKTVQNLQAAYMTAASDLQRLYKDEIMLLTQSAPRRAQTRLNDLIKSTYRRPSQKEILAARRALSSDPFDISKAKNLRELEAQGGNAAMAIYLDERIDQLKKGKTL